MAKKQDFTAKWAYFITLGEFVKNGKAYEEEIWLRIKDGLLEAKIVHKKV